jgi:arsenate reductase
MKIYHNPRCRKSRETLQLIEEKGIEPEIIEYLKEVPSEKEIADLLKKLDIPAEKLLRKGEAIFKEKYKGKELSEAEWIKAMHENPKLIERPIVVKDNKAVLGRPPENVKELF